MHLPPIMLAGLIVSMIAASPATAQLPPPPIGAMGPMMMMMKPVQKELKLSEGQVKKAEDWRAESSEKSKAFFRSIQSVPLEERRKMMAERSKAIYQDGLAFVAETLKPDQAARLRQIEIQSRSFSAFEIPEVVEQLKLSAEQKETLAALKAEYRSTAQAIRKAFPDDLDMARTKNFEAQESVQGRAVDCLNDEQRATWKRMIGEPFDLRALNGNP